MEQETKTNHLKLYITFLVLLGFLLGLICGKSCPDRAAEQHIQAQQAYITELENCIRDIGETQARMAGDKK